ncbi:hypothetical protein RF240_01095 [Dickeya dadantii]
MVIMMTLKKLLINLLCLPISINLASINLSYAALTGEQSKMMIYGAAAAGAWVGWGTLNSVLSYIERGGGPLTTTDGANIIGTICGATAAAIFRTWAPVPPNDPVTAANIILTGTKAGAVPATSITCHWVSNAFLKLIFEQGQDNAQRLQRQSPQKRKVLEADASVLSTRRNTLEQKIQIAATKERAVDDYTATYSHECPIGQLTSVDCNHLAEQIYWASLQAKAANLAVRQAAWDLADEALMFAKDEGETVYSPNRMSPRPVR